VGEFDGDENQVYTVAEMDRKGNYRLPLHLEREETCSWIITARGYRPVLKEGVAIQPIEIALPGHFVPGVGLRRHSLCVHCKRGRRRPTKGLWPQKGDFQSA